MRSIERLETVVSRWESGILKLGMKQVDKDQTSTVRAKG